jgi:regulatory protein
MARAIDPDSEGECRIRATRLLSIKSRTSKELSDALTRRGFTGRTVAGVVAYFEQRGVLDDESVARAHVAARQARLGGERLKRELSRRGVPDRTIARALAGRDAEAERESLESEFRRLWARSAPLPKEKRRRRVAAQLARRGFAADAIFEIMGDREVD